VGRGFDPGACFVRGDPQQLAQQHRGAGAAVLVGGAPRLHVGDESVLDRGDAVLLGLQLAQHVQFGLPGQGGLAQTLQGVQGGGRLVQGGVPGHLAS
jgi:hypothetical protein